ncbi:hypothetical protein HDU85_002729 [Gaertneriomyces sp. JEL0708]|nr:hypothetical protein HDU85_002729 [Gaertneriomyces sp. JEL0708]
MRSRQVSSSWLQSILQVLALCAVLSPVFAQPPPPPQQPPPPPACNPILEICPNPTCTDSENIGQVLISSPNRSSFFYIGNPINITWDYSAEVDIAQFPIQGVNLYWQKDGQRDWQEITALPARAKTHIWEMQDAQAGTGGTFRIRVVPDNIDPDGRTGRTRSCTPSGWPLRTEVAFSLIRPRTLPSTGDPFPPASSDGWKTYVPWASFLMAFGVLLSQ